MSSDNDKSQWSYEEWEDYVKSKGGFSQLESGEIKAYNYALRRHYERQELEEHKEKVEGENSGCLWEIVKVLGAIAMPILAPVLMIMLLFHSCSDSGSSSSDNTGYYEYYHDKNDTDGDGQLEGNEMDNYFNDVYN